MMMSEAVILAGQLLGMAFACGLNLYATVALLGVAARFDLIAELPIGMSGLENGVVIGAAAALYVVEVVVDRVPVMDHAWEAVHTVVRPAAAGLLVALALQGLPVYMVTGAAVLAAFTALAAHGTKAGLRLIATPRWIDDTGRVRPSRSVARTLVSMLEDIVAIGIVIAALLYPGIAVVVLAATLLLLLLAGPRLWRAALLGMRAVIARARGFFGRPGWRSREQLPRAVRAAVPQAPLGRSPARALSAAASGLPRAGAYRHGFLVFTWDGAPRFIYRARFRRRVTEFARISSIQLRPGILTDTLEIAAETRNVGNGSAVPREGRFTLFLLKDGPPPQQAAAELRTRSP